MRPEQKRTATAQVGNTRLGGAAHILDVICSPFSIQVTSNIQKRQSRKGRWQQRELEWSESEKPQIQQRGGFGGGEKEKAVLCGWKIITVLSVLKEMRKANQANFRLTTGSTIELKALK